MIIGDDDRVPMTGDLARFPYTAVGEIRNSNGLTCTGTLVAPSVVLTARHCIEGASDAVFTLPGRASSPVIARSLGGHTGDEFENDFAILRLADKFNLWAGTMPPMSAAALVPGLDTALGGDIFIQASPCALQQTNAHGLLVHGCDTGKGSSGGPVFQASGTGEPMIVALNVGEARNGAQCPLLNGVDCYNIAVPFTQFIGPLREFIGQR